MKNLFLLLVLLACSFGYKAQTAEEIINAYHQAIGGAKWDKINGMQLNASLDQGGMKIPIEVVLLKDGQTYTEITLMGNTMIMQAFDGTTVWTTNFMSMEAEKSPSDETENAKRAAKEFPNALINYKNLGYTATLLGSETIDGTACHKIKLDKKTLLAEGKEVPNIEYYYIDKENNVPILTETEIQSGEMKGKTSQTKYSDYQEVEGVYIAFSNTSGVKDGMTQTVQFDKITLNPKIDESKFLFPKK
ncbi:MAG: outer membrane lipoprotein-sorting protein [Flavobacteriia bacterium]|jgi:outer membrane lipoprotein-sorting protein|nr:outer membrane lipoprotein-sorting protein [Flavobacteriia bacterium]NBV68542.1 outer membrane lipoprotein-sorting protein [Flavobacteriia bacterium]NBV92214.1 outer membrane lipoprotein-sorting protein [Flavobacteriia bacterium]NBY40550.1 outer membrane lipoprotein-sorting protein [Flavobacteriia bacterium]